MVGVGTLGRSAWIGACGVLLVAGVPGCSLVFDGSRYRGGEDGGPGPPEDSGPRPPEDSGPRPCRDHSDCGAGEYCGSGQCSPCDADRDGFVVPACGRDPFDCNDDDADIYPGALPVCGNGVNEACGFTLPGFPFAHEIGFFVPQRLLLTEPATLLGRVRVFSMGGGSSGGSEEAALVLIHSEHVGDLRRPTPMYVTVGLTTAVSASWTDLPDFFGPDFPAKGRIWYDAQRASDNGQEVCAAMLVEDETQNKFEIRAVSLPSTSATCRLATSWYWMSDMPMTTVEVDGEIALVRRPAMDRPSDFDFYLGVPTRRMGRDSEILALGVGSTHREVLASAYRPMMPSWSSVSSGTDAVFQGELTGDPMFRLWNGSLNSMAEASHLYDTMLFKNIGGRPAIESLPSTTTGNRTIVLFVPARSSDSAPYDMIAVHVLDCPTTQRLPTCRSMPGTARISVPNLNSYDPLLAAARISSTAVILGMRTGDEQIALGAYNTSHMGFTEITPSPVPSPGDGTIVDLDVDAWVVPPDDGSSLARQVTITYAYIRHDVSSGDNEVWVGGARMCLNYAMP